MRKLTSKFYDDFAGEGRVTLVSYAFNCSGSPPVNHKSRLRDPCNIPLILLTLCECSPKRLPCLIECPRLLYCSLSLPLGKPAFLYTKYTRPPSVTSWYTISAKVVVIVATYRSVLIKVYDHKIATSPELPKKLRNQRYAH